MEHLLYFGYGSNMNPNVMKKRIGDWRSVKKAVLNDYKFVFMPRPGIVIPVIVPSKGDRVLGAIFEITKDQLTEIDKYESPYSTETVEVETADGKMTVLAYVFNLENFLMRVKDYRSNWIEGLRQHEFGDKEIAEVKKIMDDSIKHLKELA